MAKPTHASVTEEPCTCHYLEHAADDPRSPIVYDVELNEYHFEQPIPHGDESREVGKAVWSIYHCPFCGGAAPKSRRESLFAVISPEEASRLYKLLGRLKTLDEAIRTLGPPDDDDPHGLTEKQPARQGKAPMVESFRTLRYSGLSTTVDVHFTDTRTGGIHFWLQGKYVGPPLEGQRA